MNDYSDLIAVLDTYDRSNTATTIIWLVDKKYGSETSVKLVTEMIEDKTIPVIMSFSEMKNLEATPGIKFIYCEKELLVLQLRL